MKKIHLAFLVVFSITMALLAAMGSNAQVMRQTRGGGTAVTNNFAQYITSSTPLLVIGACPSTMQDIIGVLYYVTPSTQAYVGTAVMSDAGGLSDWDGDWFVVGNSTMVPYYARLHYCIPL